MSYVAERRLCAALGLSLVTQLDSTTWWPCFSHKMALYWSSCMNGIFLSKSSEIFCNELVYRGDSTQRTLECDAGTVCCWWFIASRGFQSLVVIKDGVFLLLLVLAGLWKSLCEKRRREGGIMNLPSHSVRPLSLAPILESKLICLIKDMFFIRQCWGVF